MDQAPDQTTTPAPEALIVEPKKGPAYGAILGIVLIVLVLVLGAFYVWGERLKQNEILVPQDGVPSEGTMPRGGSAEGTVEIQMEGPQPQ